MATKCGCKPGSYATGWHEVRCDECLDAELQVWYAMLGGVTQ